MSIAVEGLTKRFGSVRAVEDLTFATTPGRVTGFLGPNGAGKTTTLRMVLGLVTPTAGSALVEGQRYADLADPLRTVGAALEASSFHPGRSARDHLRVLATAGGLPQRRVDETLQLVGLADVADRRAGGFSLGMRQRLGLAAALLGDPRVLVLDEPANGLDPEGIAWLRGFLRYLAAEGRTVLISSHVLSEVQQTVDDVVIVARGRLVRQATLAELDDPTMRAVADPHPQPRRPPARAVDRRAARRPAVRGRQLARHRGHHRRDRRGGVRGWGGAARAGGDGKRPRTHVPRADGGPAVTNLLLRAELVKVRTTRMWWGLLLGACALTIFQALISAFTAGTDPGPGQPQLPDLSDPAMVRSVYGSGFAACYIFGIVFGIIGMAGEYRHQTITPTFLVTPRRSRVIVAKLVSYFGLGLLAGLVTTVIAVVAGALVIAGKGFDTRLTSDNVPLTLAPGDPGSRGVDGVRARARHPAPQPGRPRS